MAEENIYRQEFSIRDLTTKSVTLYPARAHIIRDINEIVLKVYLHDSNCRYEHVLIRY